jgi:CRISPR-associated endonuclease/helicase Cas3
MFPIAHSANDVGSTHDLKEHLEEVASLAALFADAFDSAGFARAAGLWHDLGKNAVDFQQMITADEDGHLAETKQRIDHSSAGAVHAMNHFGKLGLPIAFTIAEHHAGLAEKVELDTRLEAKADRLVAAMAPRAKVLLDAPTPTPPAFLMVTTGATSEERKRRYELWIRMLFSCLVDADFLDT